MFLVDSHCHLHQLNYKSVHQDISDVLNKANKRGVRLFLSVSTTTSDYDQMVNLVGNRSDVFFSCGVHPTYVDNDTNFDSQGLYLVSTKRNVIGIGETGLDYYYRSDNKKQQKKVFQEHIRLAKVIKKPIIVHSRVSRQDTLDLLYKEGAEEYGGVLHCFSEDVDTARSLLNINFYISFSGMITFKRFNILQPVIKYIPLDRILLETDAPYLTPNPYRGQENQPAYIYEVAEYVAFVKNMSIDKLAQVTTDNFYTLFNLKQHKIK